MPPWGKHGFYSEPEIRDIVAFLKTLKTPAKFADALEDPAKRPLPVEDRDALDLFVNPSAERIEAGEALYKKAGPNGKACIACHADPKTAFKRWAVTMPRWEKRLNKVLARREMQIACELGRDHAVGDAIELAEAGHRDQQQQERQFRCHVNFS